MVWYGIQNCPLFFFFFFPSAPLHSYLRCTYTLHTYPLSMYGRYLHYRRLSTAQGLSRSRYQPLMKNPQKFGLIQVRSPLSRNLQWHGFGVVDFLTMDIDASYTLHT
ncbi:hypothetical protein F4775DRAFT_552120 [Biscogniauxia sp. FL1348]|nr:hypothetical protein F4775DRAFT_552120 [Biscogniauxia sp. FL1348]